MRLSDLRRLAIGGFALAAVCSLPFNCGDDRHVVVVQENDQHTVLVHPGDRLDVVMTRHLYGSDDAAAYGRCMDMGGTFDQTGFVCHDVDP